MTWEQFLAILRELVKSLPEGSAEREELLLNICHLLVEMTGDEEYGIISPFMCPVMEALEL
jgi:hypothetical protein